MLAAGGFLVQLLTHCPACRIPPLILLTLGVELCRFGPRCAHALPSCAASIPVLEALEPAHTAACFRARELA